VRIPAKHVNPAWRPAIDAAAPSLLGLLEDGAATVRRAAVYLAGVGGLGVQRTLDALRGRLAAEPETGIRHDIIVSMAAAVAANRESREARDVQRELTAMSVPGTEDLQVRLAAVLGLAELGEPAGRYLPLLIQATTDSGTARWQDSSWFGPAAAGLVAHTGTLLIDNPVEALDYSLGVSRRADAAQRTAAINRVAVLTQEWRTIGDGLLPYLASELTTGEEEVRFPAAYLLGALGRNAAVYADQVAALADDDSPAGLEDDTVSDAAVRALARFRGARTRGKRDRPGRPCQPTAAREFRRMACVHGRRRHPRCGGGIRHQLAFVPYAQSWSRTDR
jgi:hypothetical protein